MLLSLQLSPTRHSVMDQYSRVRATLTILGALFLMAFSACSVSRNAYAVQSPNSNVKQSQEVIDIAHSNMTKDALRIKGTLLSQLGKENDWYQYGFQVIKTLKYGPTFASIEPSVKEEIILNTQDQLKVENGTTMIIDVTTPRERSDGKLMVFKVSN